MNKKRSIILLVLMCIAISGCASTKVSNSGHIGEIVKDMHFKGLSDQQALIFFARIYDEPVGREVDQTAKDITIMAFMVALESQESKLIMDSGVLEKPYKKVQFDKWTDSDLKTYYESLSYEYDKNYVDKHPEGEIKDISGRVFFAPDSRSAPKKEEVISTIPGKGETLEIIELTALYVVEGERIRRGNKDLAWKTASSIAMTSLSTAAQIAISMLSGFFFMS